MVLEMKEPLLLSKFTGFKVPKVPHKIVRTNSQDPAGRLHAYMQVISPVHVQRNSALSSVRSDPSITSVSIHILQPNGCTCIYGFF